MTDSVSPERRSEIMSRVRPVGSRPEMKVRRLVHGLGYRYRLHCRELPGRPDLVFKGRRKVIFVHGCFWHRHPGCKLARLPKSRQEFWLPKLERNRERDLETEETLRLRGWDVLVVWECELAGDSVVEKIKAFLDEKNE